MTLKSIFNRKAQAFLGAAAVLLAAVFTAGCQPEVESQATPEQTFVLTFSAGENGELTAKAGGKQIQSGETLTKGTEVDFTASPKSGYTVAKWTVTGGKLVSGTGADESTTAKVKVSAKTNVKVSFKIQQFPIEMTHGDNGTLTATLYGNTLTSGSKVDLGKTVTFTATPNDTFKVGEWTVSGGELESGTGKDGSETAKVKITAETKVNVTFEPIPYTKVKFSDLDGYLKNTASATDVNYIEITELTQDKVKGEAVEGSTIGKIIKDSSDKKVSLKFGEGTAGITDMTYCFWDCANLVGAPAIPETVTQIIGCFENCINLTKAPVIPANVTNLGHCFYGCVNLTIAPVIPKSVTHMDACFYGCSSLKSVMLKCDYNSDANNISGRKAFHEAFLGCHNLKRNSIKVPKEQLKAYQHEADVMGTDEGNFTADE